MSTEVNGVRKKDESVKGTTLEEISYERLVNIKIIRVLKTHNIKYTERRIV